MKVLGVYFSFVFSLKGGSCTVIVVGSVFRLYGSREVGTEEGFGEVFYLFVFFIVLELDKNRVIEIVFFGFRNLLGVLGIEVILESLIKLLCIEEYVRFRY